MYVTTAKQVCRSLGCLLIAAALAGCEAKGAEGNAVVPPPPQVDVVEVRAERVVLWSSFTGRIAAPETVNLRPRVSGYIERADFTEGELVQEGDVLFEIDKRPYQAREQLTKAELTRAQSHLKLSSSEAARARKLWEQRAISREEFEQRDAAVMAARAAVDAATANLESAQLDLSYTEIKAPITGRIGRAELTRGNLATADTTLLASIVSVDPLYVYFQSDQATAQINPFGDEGQIPVRVRFNEQSQEYVTGLLDFVNNRYDSGTGTLQYRALIANPDNRLKPGQFARVEMPIDQYSQSILLDQKAVLTDQNRRYVYVVDGDNKVARRFVQVGSRVGGLLVVGKGLEHGEQVVVNGLQKIMFPGMQVTPQLVDMRPEHTLPVLADSTLR